VIEVNLTFFVVVAASGTSELFLNNHHELNSSLCFLARLAAVGDERFRSIGACEGFFPETQFG
jgi:hypothetical protein